MARDFTLSIGTHFTGLACFVASTTMSMVGLCVDTAVFALGQSFLATDTTQAVGADFTRETGLFASTAVSLVGLLVNTFGVTDLLSDRAEYLALSTEASFTSVTLGTTCTTVYTVSVDVDARVTTVGSVHCALGSTLCGTTFVFGWAGFATGTTVSAVGSQVDTFATTVT